MDAKDSDNLAILLNKIELYFDCRLSDEEETALRRELALVSLSHPEIEAAKAVMGFRTIKSSVKAKESGTNRKTKSLFNTPLKAAAAVAAVILVAVLLTPVTDFMSSGNNRAGECIAYVNGKQITDEEAVMDILAQDLKELDKGTREMQLETYEDLDDFSAIVQEFESGETFGLENAASASHPGSEASLDI